MMNGSVSDFRLVAEHTGRYWAPTCLHGLFIGAWGDAPRLRRLYVVHDELGSVVEGTRVFPPCLAEGDGAPDALMVARNGAFDGIGPSDAYVIHALCEHDGDLWALGLRVSGTQTVPHAASSPFQYEGRNYTIAMGLERFDGSAWASVATDQTCRTLAPALWRRVEGTWTRVAVPGLTDQTLTGVPWEWLAGQDTGVRLTSTVLGLWIQTGEYVGIMHPILDLGGTTVFQASATYLLDGTGASSRVGFVARAADTGGGVEVLAIQNGYAGPPVTFLPSVLVTEYTTIPKLLAYPVRWRGKWWATAIETRTNSLILSQFDTAGRLTTKWQRRLAASSGFEWNYSWASVAAGGPTLAVFAAADQYNGLTKTGTHTQWAVMVEGEEIASAQLPYRVAVSDADDDGVAIVTTDLTTAPYGAVGPASVNGGLPGEYGYRPVVAYPERTWALRLRSAKPAIFGIRLEWAWGDHEQQKPSIDAVTLEFGDGSRANVPEVGAVTADWSDGTATSKPEVATVEAQWAASEDTYVNGRPSVDTVSAEYAEVGAATTSPQIYTVQEEWAEAPGEPGTSDRVLFLTNSDDVSCFMVRVTSTLTNAQEDLCRVLVRADLETLAVNAWDSYQRGALGQSIMLENPGRAVRVAIIGPNTLPASTDFIVTFERG